MVGPSSPLKLLNHLLRSFSHKSPSSNSNSTKLKNLFHTLIISHICKIIRAMSKANSACIAATIKAKCQFGNFTYSTKDKKAKKMLFGSFRMHYNWCSSSRVMHVPPSVLDCAYYNSSWNTAAFAAEQEQPVEDSSEAQLSGYLKWLEEEKLHGNYSTEKEKQYGTNDIDKLAEIFIASCHEKFILEKQESNRRFHEMLARSM